MEESKEDRLLNIIKSNRMETLVQALCQVLSDVPQDVMAKEWIAVQSRGMRQWVSQEVARALGVCANVGFKFPRQIMEAIILTGREEDGIPVTREMLMWAVLDVLWHDQDHGRLGELEKYIREDVSGRKRLQLSQRIAAVLDDYQVYRPDMIMHWLKSGMARPGQDRTLKSMEDWQAFLWNRAARGKTNFALGMDAYLKGPERASTGDLPPRIILFGISALPVSFLALLSKASRYMDVFLFLMTPCSQFFFDIPTPRQAGLRSLEPGQPADAFGLEPNPLLASLGRTGRDFNACLEELDYHEPFGDLFQDPGEEGDCTMLKVIQSDILGLVCRRAGTESGPVAVLPRDRSISIHACHSPMREAQVLKDLLLDMFGENPTLAPHEVIVMMPDVEAYAPYIQSVFAMGSQKGPFIPFSLSDRRKRIESGILEAFLKVLSMNRTRLEKTHVLDLLQSRAIALKFGISEPELAMVDDAAEKAGILWGRDAGHRQALTGTGFKENTWLAGLDRLFMGYGAAGEDFCGDTVPVLYFEGLEAGVLGRFAHFAHTLFDLLKGLDRTRPVAAWADWFRTAAQSMLERVPDNEADLNFLFQVIEDLDTEADQAGFKGEIGFDVAREILENKLDQQKSQGGFLTGDMTFCNLTPMRSIPFKVVALMGMDESSFPRSGIEAGFDLGARSPRKGDKNARDEDRYLFLETLMSARKQIIITYTGMDIKDNSPIPSSGVVSELADVMDQSFVFPKGYQYRFGHPLHGFDPVYFGKSPEYFSYSDELCRIARAQAKKTSLQGEGFQKPDSKPGQDLLKTRCESEDAALDLEDLVRFFHNPARNHVQKILGIDLPALQEPLPDREPFEISGLDRFHLGKRMLDHAGSEPEAPSFLENAGLLYPLLKARGALPLGQKGRMEFFKVAEQARPIADKSGSFFPRTPVAPVSVRLGVHGIGIFGQVEHIYREKQGLIRCKAGFGRLSPQRLLKNWIIHLALNLALAGGSGPDRAETRLMGQDPKARKPVVVCTMKSLGEDARPLLETLVQLYLDGRNRVVPFFCNAGFSLVSFLAEKKYPSDKNSLVQALSRARIQWESSFGRPGEGADPHIRLCLKEENPFDNVQALGESGALEASLAVYRPLLENMTWS